MQELCKSLLGSGRYTVESGSDMLPDPESNGATEFAADKDSNFFLAKIQSLSSAFVASRVELRDALQQKHKLEEHVDEQRAAYDAVNKKLLRLSQSSDSSAGFHELLTARDTSSNPNPGTASDAHNLKYKTLLDLSEKRCREQDRIIQELNRELQELKETVAISRDCQRELQAAVVACARSAENRAMDYIQEQSALLRAEADVQVRELTDAFCKEREVRMQAAYELNRELQRLREELFTSQQVVADQKSLVEILKIQLIKAADM